MTAPLLAPSVVIVDDDLRRSQWVRESAALAGRHMLAVSWGPQVRPLIQLLAPELVIAGVSANLDSPRQIIRGVREDGYIDPIVVVGGASQSLRAAGASECVEVGRGPKFDALLASFDLRAPAPAPRENATRFVHCGDAVVDLTELTIMRGGRLHHMSPTAGALFRALLRADGATVSRADLLEEVWSEVEATPRVVDQHVSRLRRQLEVDPRRPQHLHTVFGLGYKLSGVR